MRRRRSMGRTRGWAAAARKGGVGGGGNGSRVSRTTPNDDSDGSTGKGGASLMRLRLRGTDVHDNAVHYCGT